MGRVVSVAQTVIRLFPFNNWLGLKFQIVGGAHFVINRACWAEDYAWVACALRAVAAHFAPHKYPLG